MLVGDIDEAIILTKASYPDVLVKREAVLFWLKCCKLIEMIRKEAELNLMHGNNASNGNEEVNTRDNGTIRANGHSHKGMDVDDVVMDEDNSGSQARPEGRTLVDEALRYGQMLQIEFRSDFRPVIQKTLNEIFSLLAYANPFKQPEVAHLFDQRHRVAVAEFLNAAILGMCEGQRNDSKQAHVKFMTDDKHRIDGEVNTLSFGKAVCSNKRSAPGSTPEWRTGLFCYDQRLCQRDPTARCAVRQRSTVFGSVVILVISEGMANDFYNCSHSSFY